MGNIETKKSEADLINRAKRNPQAFAPLYEKYYVQIFRFVLKRVQNKETAADVVSQTFMKAILHIRKYEDRGFPFSSWLYRIAVNECNQYFRQAKKMIEVELSPNHINSLFDEMPELDKTDDRKIILDALNLLKFEEVNIIEMRFFEGRKFKDIGEILGITEENAKMRVYRILKKLKEKISR